MKSDGCNSIILWLRKKDTFFVEGRATSGCDFFNHVHVVERLSVGFKGIITGIIGQLVRCAP